MSQRRASKVRALAAVLAFVAGAATGRTVSIDGETAEFDVPPNPRASLVLLAGDAGISEADPLQRARAAYVARGFAVLSIDQKVNVRAAMKFASETARPVSIAAVSSGVRRLAGAIAAPGFRARSVVLVSGPLDLVRELVGRPQGLPPTLVIHHRRDACSKTPPAQVESFVQWGAGKVTVQWMDGGSSSGDPCGPQSHHGLAGLDDEVVKAISDFAQP